MRQGYKVIMQKKSVQVIMKKLIFTILIITSMISLADDHKEKKDFDMIYEMLMEFKEGELFDKKLPEVDKPKLTLFINTILEKGRVIFAKDLDKEELMGLCMFHKAEYWFSKDKIMNIENGNDLSVLLIIAQE